MHESTMNSIVLIDFKRILFITVYRIIKEQTVSYHQINIKKKKKKHFERVESSRQQVEAFDIAFGAAWKTVFY